MAESSFKVIRDRIPDIIGLSDSECSIDELVDLLEIIYGIAELRGSSKDELEVLRLRKREEKEGLEKNLVLLNRSEEKSPFTELHSIDPEKSSLIVFKPENTEIIEKHGVRMRIYTTKSDCINAAVLYQETETGHAEEFMHEVSNFIYYVIEGSGTWIVEDKEHEVEAGDVVVVPAGKRFWFRGNLKQVCITAPAWEEQYEHHIRDINL